MQVYEYSVIRVKKPVTLRLEKLGKRKERSLNRVREDQQVKHVRRMEAD